VSYPQRRSRIPCAAMTATSWFCFAEPKDAEAFAKRLVVYITSNITGW
jgi:hypothetical protein